jgi:hypothetical protein
MLSVDKVAETILELGEVPHDIIMAEATALSIDAAFSSS